MNTNQYIETLRDSVLKHCKREGDHATALPELTLHIRNAPTEPLHCIYTLSLAVTIQGAKQISYEGNILPCSAGQSMLTTVDLPVISHVTHASRHNPFVALVLKLDYTMLLQTASELNLDKPVRDIKYQPISIHDLDSGLTDALKRLIELQSDNQFAKSLIPLVEKEIIIRLLQGPHGLQLRHLASSGVPSSQILKVVTWLKHNFAQTVEMDELAEKAHMSGTTFRQHFKTLTGTSPLQYLKTLRLQEARDQMLMNGLDATQASSMVGYESATQFSREYSRLFGLPPQKDIQRLRKQQLPIR
ncbi:AraC family transcriptional regulator [Shewanella mangrovisoli]|uniref:AraC family transcriptional regulator n=1 Tax=Shewanella mangrovisoli TaxID=2864211 RepID=UPI0035B7F702